MAGPAKSSLAVKNIATTQMAKFLLNFMAVSWYIDLFAGWFLSPKKTEINAELCQSAN
jgi:hypothetical protein